MNTEPWLGVDHLAVDQPVRAELSHGLANEQSSHPTMLLGAQAPAAAELQPVCRCSQGLWSHGLANERSSQQKNAAGRCASFGSGRIAASLSPQPRAAESRSRERKEQPSKRCAGIGSRRTSASPSPQPQVVKSRSRERGEQPPSNAASKGAGVRSTSSSSRHIPKNHNATCGRSQGSSSTRASLVGAEGSRAHDPLHRLSQHLSAEGQRHRECARLYEAMARQTEVKRTEVLQHQRELAMLRQGILAATEKTSAAKPTPSPRSTFR